MTKANSSYIPVKRFSERDLKAEKKEIDQKKIELLEEIAIAKEEMSKYEVVIKRTEQPGQGINFISTPFKDYVTNPIERLSSKITFIFNSLTYTLQQVKLDQYSYRINDLEGCYSNINNSAAQIDENNVVTNQPDLLREGDLMLAFGNYEQALIQYKKILANRDKRPLDENYIPQDEKLRQAAELSMELKPIIQGLDLEYEKKLDLYISFIAAHTQGEFSLTESEISDMIDKGFYYSSYGYDLT